MIIDNEFSSLPIVKTRSRVRYFLVNCSKTIFQSYFFLQPVYQDVLQHEPTVKQVLNKLEAALSEGEKQDELEKTTLEIRTRWDSVHDSVIKRHAQINRIIPNAQKHSKELSTINPWLDDAEQKLTLLSPLNADSDDLKKRKRELQVILLWI